MSKLCGVTLSAALKLSRFFGVYADFWLALRIRWDLYKAKQQEEQELEQMREYHHLHRPAE